MIIKKTTAHFWLRDNRTHGPVAVAAFSTMSLRIVNVVIGIATTALLGRMLGADGFGVFAVGLASAALILGPMQLALNHHIVNKTAQYASAQNWALLNGIRRYTMTIALASSLTLAAIAATMLTFGVSGPIGFAVFIGVAMAPFMITDSMASALLRGLGEIGKAYFPQFLVMQSLHLTFTLTLAITGKLTPQTALYSLALAWVICATLSWFLVLRSWPSSAKSVQPLTRATEWGRSAIFILIGGVGGVLFGRIETLALAHFSAAVEIGVYAMAFRFAQFVTFPAFALASGITSEVSRFVALNDPYKAQYKASVATRLATGMALLASVGLFMVCSVLFPIINPDFQNAAIILLILSTGYIVQSASGFPMAFLVAFNLERDMMLPGSVVALGGASIVLIAAAHYGAVGAAFATTAAVSATALLRALVVYKNVDIRCDILAGVPKGA